MYIDDVSFHPHADLGRMQWNVTEIYSSAFLPIKSVIDLHKIHAKDWEQACRFFYFLMQAMS